MPAAGLEHDGEPVAVTPPPPGVEPVVVDLGYLGQMQALVRAHGGRPSPVDARFGRAVLDVVCGAYASAGSGGPVPLPFSGSRDRTPLELWRG